jgi:hypothetical protein
MYSNNNRVNLSKEEMETVMVMVAEEAEVIK